MKSLLHEMPALTALKEMGLDDSQILPSARMMDDQIASIKKDGTLTDDGKTLKIAEVGTKVTGSIISNLEKNVGELSASIETLEGELYSAKTRKEGITPSQSAMLPEILNRFRADQPMTDNKSMIRSYLELETMGLLTDISKRVDSIHSQETLTSISKATQAMDTAIRLSHEVRDYANQNVPTGQAEQIQSRVVVL